MRKIRFRLSELLKEKKVYQKDLMELTGIAQSTISDLCTNKRSSVKMENLDKIINALEIKCIDELIEIVEIGHNDND